MNSQLQTTVLPKPQDYVGRDEETQARAHVNIPFVFNLCNCWAYYNYLGNVLGYVGLTNVSLNQIHGQNIVL